ncbi:hypothetical protein E3N88_13794 [Mikania micrantha]|uniref:Uncharacterized protein n=1 Tax=Mikania micrantha TaxID=192012 RepID=A0A5N6NZL7_9ASTR|nr:hypothetical protein E3N88_13794 [Mikania micrantha]
MGDQHVLCQYLLYHESNLLQSLSEDKPRKSLSSVHKRIPRKQLSCITFGRNQLSFGSNAASEESLLPFEVDRHIKAAIPKIVAQVNSTTWNNNNNNIGEKRKFESSRPANAPSKKTTIARNYGAVT